MQGFVDPDRDRFRAFAGLDLEGPVHMLNLLRLRDRAVYEDGRDATGAEAYNAYSREAARFFQGAGGIIVWRGVPKAMVIGPSDETWDLGFIAGYPSKDHFLKMVKDEGYQGIVHHRQAAVATSRLYCFEAAETGALFA